MEGNEFTAIDAAGAAWSIKSILSNVQRTSFLIEIFVLAITVFMIVLTVFLAIKVLRIIFGYLNPIFGGIFDFLNSILDWADSILEKILSIPKKIYNFIFRRNSAPPEENISTPDEYQESLMALEPSEIESDVIKLVNANNAILNNRDDLQNAKTIRQKLESENKSYRKVEISALQNVVLKIRNDVTTRQKILSVLKNNPRLILGKTSTAAKTICHNLGLNDAAKDEISVQIDVIKKMHELYKNGANNPQISQETKTFDFEINQFTSIFREI